jgi:hypothetical protein
MKPDTGARRISTTGNMPLIHDDAASRHQSASRLDREPPSGAEQKRKENTEEERKDPRFGLIITIEQWICLLLGIACIASGIWGVFLKPSQNPLPASLAWFATAFVPTLRITAVACLVMGLVLVRRGLAWH